MAPVSVPVLSAFIMAVAAAAAAAGLADAPRNEAGGSSRRRTDDALLDTATTRPSRPLETAVGPSPLPGNSNSSVVEPHVAFVWSGAEERLALWSDGGENKRGTHYRIENITPNTTEYFEFARRFQKNR